MVGVKDNTKSIKRRTLHMMIFSCKMLQIKIRVSVTFFFKIPLKYHDLGMWKNRNSLDRVTLPLLKDINNLPLVKRGKIARYTKKTGGKLVIHKRRCHYTHTT